MPLYYFLQSRALNRIDHHWNSRNRYLVKYNSLRYSLIENKHNVDSFTKRFSPLLDNQVTDHGWHYSIVTCTQYYVWLHTKLCVANHTLPLKMHEGHNTNTPKIRTMLHHNWNTFLYSWFFTSTYCCQSDTFVTGHFTCMGTLFVSAFRNCTRLRPHNALYSLLSPCTHIILILH